MTDSQQPSAAIGGIVLFLALAASLPSAEHGAPALTTVAQIRALMTNDAAARPAVRLRGAVTYHDADWDLLFLDDKTGGVMLQGAHGDFALRRGDWVEVTGVAAVGELGLFVVQHTLRPLPERELPAPAPAALAEVVRGDFLAQFLEVRGVVRSLDRANRRAILHLHSGDVHLNFLLRDVAPGDPRLAALVDAVVSVRGVCRALPGKAVRLLAPGLDDVVVEKPAPAHPYAVASTAIAELAAVHSEHRIKVLGSVNAIKAGGVITVRDGSGQIDVQADHPEEVRTNDLTEILGFVTRERGRGLLLEHATWRPIAPSGLTNTLAQVRRGHFPPAPHLPVLQRIEDIRQLSSDDAELQFPVRLRAMVTFHDRRENYLFVRGPLNGVYVDSVRTHLDFHPGQMVEVTGYTRKGMFMPIVGRAEVTVIGEGELPRPREPLFSNVQAGKEDCQWIALPGIIRRARMAGTQLWLRIDTSGGTFDAMVPSFEGTNEGRHLVDAGVRIVGVCGARVNERRQITRTHLFVPSLEYVTVLREPPADPFALPTHSVASLFQFSPEDRPGHRTKIKGVVTLQRRPGGFFLKDRSGPLSIALDKPDRVQPGDEVEVVGFPISSAGTFGMRGALFRKTGVAPLPEPLTFDPAHAGELDADYVKLEGRLIEIAGGSNAPALFVQAGDSVVEAALVGPDALPALRRIKPGSLLRLTGICASQRDEQTGARSFRILLGTPPGVAVLQTPPWWTRDHALMLAGTLGFIIAGALAWVALLRRQVRRQTAAIVQLNGTLEERVADRTAALAAANQELESFSYSISHDLRAPLRAINGFSEILLSSCAERLDERSRHYLRSVASSGRRMGQLVDDLLAFSRLGRQPLARREIDLTPLAGQHLDELRRSDPQREVEVRLLPLPPAQCDPALISQVLVNLVGNAWKFTGKTPGATIEIGARGTNGETVYYVKDNGAGFDMNYADKLFGVFQRLHGEGEFPGTGVGLAIVHRVIHRHGGRIWAEAAPGQGATFYFTLPGDSLKKEP